MSNIKQHIIGLSGHIDHGKTSIVKALTGINTDNLKEEEKRGMTINIGFAFLNENITMIDVPGHEKFIKNMVTGVNAIDYALLVIAADDGIMPQTIEHFEILKMLNIMDGSIIINKIDSVDNDWLDLVEKDIKEFVKGSFLEDKKVHKVSAINNTGLVDLKDFLINYNYNVNNIDSGIFRLFVDRTFVSKGFGSIVTGTVLSGKVSVGDKIKILPQNKEIKIRGLETHYNSVKELKMGDRCAINVQSTDKMIIKKGNHLSEKNFFTVYESAIVSIKLINKINKTVKNNERLRIYCGTQEVMGRIQFFNNKELNPGDECGALLKFEKPLILSIGDKFIIRRYSPLKTIGGGKILDFYIHKKWKDNKTYILNIYSAQDEYSRLKIIIESRYNNPFTLISLGNYLNVSEDVLKLKIKNIDNVVLLDNVWILTNKQLNSIFVSIIEYFEKFHNQYPYKKGMIKDEIINSLSIKQDFLDVILGALIKKKEVRYSDNIWSKYDFSIKLSNSELNIMKEVFKLINDRKLNALTINELTDFFNEDHITIKKILNIQVLEKSIIILDASLIFSRQNIDSLIKNINDFFIHNDSLNIKQFKELTGTTRKFAVPLLEYLDKINITYRIGNERKLR